MFSIFIGFAQYISKPSSHALHVKMIIQAALMISLAILIIVYLVEIEEKDTL
ncbi:hypothetical protein O185_03835 [Photorhabdus temperata J3]|uniref:Uncharacterized protein n=1 Tax=Photorhabdus temperata J3 TaxID=1389415 RepID=U7R6T8_PHOTE|nr:hypothetical protein O185_03835 [Photorhabdus temperata J3]